MKNMKVSLKDTTSKMKDFMNNVLGLSQKDRIQLNDKLYASDGLFIE